MSSERTFHRVILALTIAIMSAILIRIDPKFVDEKPLEVLVGILTGTGLHEALLRTVEFMLNRLKPVKRLILRSSYVEGIWIGFYESTPGRPRFAIETIRQEWSSLCINGRAYNEKGEHHGQWSSITATVDGKSGLLRGIYSGDLASGHYESIGTFQLQGDPPDKMSGQIFDSVATPNAARAWIRLEKNSAALSEEEALQKAIAMYAKVRQMRAACDVPGKTFP